MWFALAHPTVPGTTVDEPVLPASSSDAGSRCPQRGADRHFRQRARAAGQSFSSSDERAMRDDAVGASASISPLRTAGANPADVGATCGPRSWCAGEAQRFERLVTSDLDDEERSRL